MSGPHINLFAAWPFANSWMLLWGLAAVVPIIIHLWSRQKYDEIAWAAIDHLLAAVRKNAKRLQLEQLILLAVRTAILLLFAAALADPVISSFATLGGATEEFGNTHTMLVLDASYSMDYRQQEASRFERGVKLAKDIVCNSQQGDAFTLLRMTDEPSATIGSAAYDNDDVITEIDAMQRSDGGADLLATLTVVRDTIEHVRESEPRLTKHRVCFITDLGRTTWGAVSDDAVRSALGEIATMAQLELLNVGSIAAENATITHLSTKQNVATLTHPVQFQVELENRGSEDIVNQTVSLFVDGERVWDRQIDIPARGQASVATQHIFRVAGQHGIEARLAHDSLAADNHRWLSLAVREAIKVLCVEGKFGAARNVALALSPDNTASSHIQVTTGSENALLEEDLHQYDAVFLSNVGRFAAAEAKLLEEYVQAGGGLVIFLGDQVQPENYNRWLGARDDRPNLLGCTLGAAAVTDEYTVDPLNYEHPLLEVFRGNEQAGLLTTPIWKYFRVTSSATEATQTALALQNGDPLITTAQHGAGRTILIATAATSDSMDRNVTPPTPWTAWPAWPSFPPSIQQMLEYAIGGAQQAKTILVGETIEGSFPLDSTSSAMTIEDPASQRQRVSVRSPQAPNRWVFSGTHRSGLYRVRTLSDDKLLGLFAVNVNTRESQLAQLDSRELPSQLQREPPTLSTSPGGVEPPGPTHYFRHLLALVLCLLLTESCLAWFFGRSFG